MHIHTIDLHFQGMPGVIAAFLLESVGQWALIETGPGSCHDALVTGLRAAGAEPSQVRHVFVTHIHLDHAGGVGDLARLYPRARIVVQERGARHLADPTRLMASARLVFGSVLASYNEEQFSLERMRSLTDADIAARYESFKLFSHFEVIED